MIAAAPDQEEQFERVQRSTDPAAVVAAVALIAMAAVPASASAANTVGANIYYEASLAGPNQLVVTYQCQAGAVPAAVSVAISCGVRERTSLALPGNFVLTNEGEFIPNEPFSVCWTATAQFLDGSQLSTSGCTPRSIQLVGFGASHTEG